MAASSKIQWTGKLPATGDFVQRHMPAGLVSRWSHWFTLGLSQRQPQLSPGTPLFAGPVWNFVLPATLGVPQVQLGCLLPSRDRVGRVWPLLAQQTLSSSEWHPAQLAVAGEWFRALGATLLEAVNNQRSAEGLEQVLQSLPPLSRPASHQHPLMADGSDQPLPCRLAWQEVARRFEPQQYTSYWWTNQADGSPLLTHRHSGNLTGELFSQLFHPAAGQRTGRHGLYPPMFD